MEKEHNNNLGERMAIIETKLDNIQNTLSTHIECQKAKDDKQDSRLDYLEKQKASSSEVSAIKSLLLKIGLWLIATTISAFGTLLWYMFTHYS